MSVDPERLATLFAVAAVAGAFDAIAGGGGLLTVPALLLAGLDPVAALATNKLQGAISSISSTSAFARRGLIDWRSAWPVAVGAAVGAQVGSRLAIRFGAKLIRPLLVVMSCLMAVKLLSDAQNPLRQLLANVLAG